MLGKLHKMMANGGLTPYLYRRCLASFRELPDNMKEEMLEEASIMSGVGVRSEDDHKNFMYVSMHIKSIANDISARPLSTEQLAKISSLVYADRTSYPIDTIFSFYKATDRAMRNLQLPMKKVAYPVGMSGITPDAPRNVVKWMQALREIYARVHRGFDYQKAFDKVTSDWDIMEKQDFKAWNRFYSEGTQNKYKTAQVSDYYQAEDGSPLLPFRDLKANPAGFGFDLPSHIEEEKQRRKDEQEAKDAERKEQIEETRKKLISRLTSAERLATDMSSQEDLNQAIDMGLSKWLEMLHALKRSIQTAPIRSAASPILYDLIIRKSNQLKHEGYVKSGALLVKIAEETKAPPVGELEVGAPAGSAPADPLDLAEEVPDEDSEWSKDFIKMLNNKHLEEDESESESEADDEIVVEAQAVPAEEFPMEELVEEPAPEMAGPEAAIEVEEPDYSLDRALEGVTIEDVIENLEMVANIVQNREIPRQLSFIDMKMGKLGIATFFPSLGEAIRSALESHQYMYTRIEDIIAKLRGSVQPEQTIELTPDEDSEEATSETLEAVRKNLTESERAERERQEARRARREQAEAAPPAPPVTPEEIAGPVEVESAPPTRAT